MYRTFKYRIYGNKETISNAEYIMEMCRKLYNASLYQRKERYKRSKEQVSLYSQFKELSDLRRCCDEYDNIDSHLLRYVLKDAFYAYKSFWARVKVDGRAGLPRFKGKGRYHSFTLEDSGWKLEGKYLIIHNIGVFKVKLSRPIIGNIKTISIRRIQDNQWYACVSCDNVPQNTLPQIYNEIGIDVGLIHFSVDSEGISVDNPRYMERSQQSLSRKQRRMCRRKKGSNRRNQSRIQVAKCYRKIKNQRMDFHYKLAKSYVDKYDKIYIEDLQIKNMVKNHRLARSISDAGWGQFFDCLECKAEEAGRKIVKVNPQGTSQRCSRCGNIVPKTLAVRVHDCPYCGLVLDRDHNSARDILRLGQSLQAQTKENTLSVACASI